MTSARNQVVTPRSARSDRHDQHEHGHEHESALEASGSRVVAAVTGLWHRLQAAIAPSDSVDE